MEEQMLFENLDEKLEDELAVITTTWLSINFELPIGEAEGLLNKYFTSHPHLSAVFLLTGLSSEGELTVRLTPNEKLKECEAVFVGKPVRTIYSVQRHPCRSSTTVATCALFSDISADALKKLVTIPWCPTESSRQPLASCENKQNEIRKQPDIPVASNHSRQIEKPKTSDISNFFTTTSKPSSTTVLQKQGQKRPSTFDTKPGKKVSPKKTVPEKPVAFISKSTDQEEEEEEFLTSAVLRSSKRKRLIIDSDEETTTDPVEKVPQSRASPRKSADRDQKTTTKATKKILAADSETDSPTPKPARGRRPRSAAAATETERESSIASPSRESRTTVCSPKKPQASKPKSPVKMNRRRRQVLKTFMDDDGYMGDSDVFQDRRPKAARDLLFKIMDSYLKPHRLSEDLPGMTEKVWESASENDEEPDEPIEAVQSAVDAKPCVSPSKHDTDARLTGTPTLGSTKSAPLSKKPSKKINPKAGTKQASISSFFSRT